MEIGIASKNMRRLTLVSAATDSLDSLFGKIYSCVFRPKVSLSQVETIILSESARRIILKLKRWLRLSSEADRKTNLKEHA